MNGSHGPNTRDGVFRALFQASAAVRELVDPRELAEQIAEQVRQLLRAQVVSVYVWCEDSGALLSITAHDGSPSVRDGIAGEAFRHQRPALSPAPRRGGCSAAAVPLIAGKRAIGVLLVAHDQPRTYGVDDLNTLALFAALIAPALDRARWRSESEVQRSAAALQSERLTQILDQLPSGVIVLDNRGFVLLSNRAVQRACDFEIHDDRPWVDQLEGFVAYEPAGRHELHRDDGPAARVLAGERVEDAEVLVQHAASGIDQWLRVDGVPFHDAQGRSSGAILVFTDVTRERTLARDLAATALEHAKLLGQVADQKERLELLADQVTVRR